MSRAYTLDTKAAAAADNTISRIDASGKYVGTLTRAEAVVSRQQTEGVEFSFKSDDGQQADFLTLWTYNVKDEALPSLKALNAVMTICRAKTITPTDGQVEKWDAASHSRQKVAATIFPELTGKRIGLLLQREEYAKSDGSVGAKMNIFGVFDPDTELTASEILAKKTQPEVLARMVAALKDKPLNGSKPQPAAQPVGGSPDLDDDSIPF